MMLDPDVSALLLATERAGVPRVETVTPAEARENFRKSRLVAALPLPAQVSAEQLVISTDTGSLPAMLYRPQSSRDEKLPALLFFHGGGWVVGDVESYGDICSFLSSSANCCVISVGYRLAPEHKFPVAVMDAAASLAWLVSNADRHGIDAQRISVGGDSAGANLAAVIAIMARENGVVPIVSQLLIYPVTDLTLSLPAHSEAIPGARFTSATMGWFRDHYLNDDRESADWRASPLFADNLEGVAPAFILTAGADPLRDDGSAYADRLRASGVYVRHAHYPNQVHAFINFGRLLPAATAALDEIGAELRRAFGDRPPL